MKGVAAIYTDSYLPISMTFVHRQVAHRGEYEKVVCAKSVRNLDLYPHDPVIAPDPARAFRFRIANIIARTARFEFIHPSRSEIEFWVERLRGVSLIHAHFGSGGLAMLPVKRALGVPLVTTFHGADLSRLLRNSLYARQLIDLFRDCDLNIAVSEYFGARLRSLGCPRERVVVHHVGVPTEEYAFMERRVDSSRVRLLQVANFVKKKGHLILLEAFERLLSAKKEAVLVLVGDGPERRAIESKIRRLRLGDRVVLKGELPARLALEEMQNTHIYVHHSITAPDGDEEGIPTAIMEAMSAGIPVVSSYHSGIPELVVDRETGMLTKENDAAGMAERILELIENPNLYSRIAVQARRAVEQGFDLDTQNRELETLYSSVADRR